MSKKKKKKPQSKFDFDKWLFRLVALGTLADMLIRAINTIP